MKAQTEAFCAHPAKLLLEAVKVFLHAEVYSTCGGVVGRSTPHTPSPHCPREISLACEEFGKDHAQGWGATLPFVSVDLERSRGGLRL